MSVKARRSAVAAAGVTLVMIATGCGSSSSTRGATKPTNAAVGSTTTTAKAGPLDPNAPEVVAPGDIPDTQVFVPYAGAGFSFKVPEGWSQSASGGTTTFTDHYNTVSATPSTVPAAPTVASARTGEVPALQRQVPNFELVDVKAVNRTAGPVVLVTYRAGSAADPVTGKRVAIDVERYEFWRNGTQVTLTLSGARGSDNVDPWKTITDSFTWAP